MDQTNHDNHITPSRRAFLGTTAAISAGAMISPVATATPWEQLDPIPPKADLATMAPPTNFPRDIPLFKQAFRNWSRGIQIDDLWTCQPTSVEDLITIANWAAENRYRIRPRGYSHNWSPIVVSPESNLGTRVILLDMTEHFKDMTMTQDWPPAVTVGAGASMESLLTYLENEGYGVTSCPAPGDLSVGGVLAIDGHGTGIPAEGETREVGQTYGTMSNRVLSLKCVAWNHKNDRYELMTFDRSHPDTAAMLVALGRTIVVEAELRVEENHNLRCESYVSISAEEMFAPAGASGRTMESFLNSSGRIEAIWYPFTSNPWLKVWTVQPTKPFWAREVSGPFNYPFSDNLSEDVSNLIGQIMDGAPGLTPQFGQLMATVTSLGLLFDNAFDLWGPSKNLLLYVKPTTLRVTANGYAVLTRRADVQRVIHEFVNKYNSMLQAYADDGRYPINGPMEIRVTGLDDPAHAELEDACDVPLSAVVPCEDHPDWDCAVWLDLLTVPRTPFSGDFYAELEQWMFENYVGDYASMRVEWSKGWGYTGVGPWTSDQVINKYVPQTLTDGRPAKANWNSSVSLLQEMDPHGIYRNPFLDKLMPS